MCDQPQPTCGRIKNDGAERGGADHYAPEKDCLSKPPVWIGREHFPILLARMLSPSIPFKLALRPALGVIDFTRRGDRSEAGEPRPHFGADRDVNGFDEAARSSHETPRNRAGLALVPNANFA
jgi:hypothetical protein